MQNKKTLSQKEIIQRIDSNHREVKTWKELNGLFEKKRDSAWIFRGVTSPSFYPVPAIGREKIYGSYKLAQERRLFDEFKNRAVALNLGTNFNNWHWLAFAQHIGVPTRLLDWSVSPLVALFFALEGEADTDRVIYAMKYSKYLYEVEQNEDNPFSSVEGRFSPPLAFDRIRVQRGVFTIHPIPTRVFYPSNLETILISNDKVHEFRRRLYKYGIDHWHIYPDMHGLGQQLQWQYKHKIGLGKIFTDDSKYG